MSLASGNVIVTTDKIVDGAVTAVKLADDYVNVTGDTMTGDLFISNSVLPAIRLCNSTAASTGFRITSQAGGDARLDVTDNVGSFAATVAVFSAAGAATFALVPKVTGAQDTSDTALTRKDYVDALNLFNMQFLLPIGSNDTFTLLQSASFGFTIDKAYYQTASGTITSDIKIEGTSVTGLSALAVSSTEGNASSTAADTVSVGGKVTLVTTANTAGTMTSVMLECTRT